MMESGGDTVCFPDALLSKIKGKKEQWSSLQGRAQRKSRRKWGIAREGQTGGK